MRLLVTGANGQVGWELSRSLMPLGDVVALDRRDAIFRGQNCCQASFAASNRTSL